MASATVSVGFYGKDDMVSLTVGRETLGLSPSLARDIAIDLMIWADRIDPPKNNKEKNDE